MIDDFIHCVGRSENFG